jgi:hypothetical protein
MKVERETAGWRNIAISPATLKQPIYGFLVAYPEAGLPLLQ